MKALRVPSSPPDWAVSASKRGLLGSLLGSKGHKPGSLSRTRYCVGHRFYCVARFPWTPRGSQTPLPGLPATPRLPWTPRDSQTPPDTPKDRKIRVNPDPRNREAASLANAVALPVAVHKTPTPTLVQLRFVSFRVDASWRKRKKQTKKNNKQTPTPISLWLAL